MSLMGFHRDIMGFHRDIMGYHGIKELKSPFFVHIEFPKKTHGISGSSTENPGRIIPQKIIQTDPRMNHSYSKQP